MEANKPVLELELYLIRHGQSMGNKGYGRDNLTLREMADPVLTDLGKLRRMHSANFMQPQTSMPFIQADF